MKFTLLKILLFITILLGGGIYTADGSNIDLKTSEPKPMQDAILTDITSDWTIGVELGNYITYELLFNSINPSIPVGATFTETITGISENEISFVTNWTGTDSIDGPGEPLTFPREGYDILLGAVVRPLTTTNVTYLEEEFKLNSSWNLRFKVNEKNFTIHDYYYQSVHEHYHNYNATFDRATGWVVFLEINEILANEVYVGLFKFAALEFTGRPPSKVTGLSGSAISATQIDLVWNVNSESNVESYNIYRDSQYIAAST